MSVSASEAAAPAQARAAAEAPGHRPSFLALQRVLAVALAAATALAIEGFPTHRAWLALAVGGYFLFALRHAQAWLVLLPAMLATVDVAPWSGRVLFNALDMLLLATLAACLWHGLFVPVRLRLGRTGGALLGLFVATQALATVRGLAAPDAGEGAMAAYLEAENAWRLARGLFWPLLLLPPLAALAQAGAPVARRLAAGMMLALAACALTVAWERWALVPVYSLQASYRAAGLLSGANTGAPAVEGFLVLTLPFAAAAFCLFRGGAWWLAGAALVVLGLHTLLVTFSASALAAAGVAALVLLARDAVVARRSRRRGAGWLTALAVAVALGAAGVVAYVVSGVVSGEPAAALAGRVAHARAVLSTLHGPAEWLLGHGTGSYPRLRHEAGEPPDGPARVWLMEDATGHFARLSASDPGGGLMLRQRLYPAAGTGHVLHLRLRGHGAKRQRLLLEICERGVAQRGAHCPWVGIDLDPAAAGQWKDYARRVHVTGAGQPRPLLAPAIELSILNRGLHAPVDLAAVQIVSAEGHPLLRNPGFEAGFDRWFLGAASTDDWHTRGQWLSTLVEGGLAGLLALLAFSAWLLARLLPRTFAGDPLAALQLATLAGLLTLGLFAPPLDVPRVAVLATLLALSVVAGFAAEDARAAARPLLPWFRLGGLYLVGGTVLLGAAASWMMHQRGLGAADFTGKVLERTGIAAPGLERALAGEPRYLDHVLDGRVKRSHPRILVPEASRWSGREPFPPVAERARAHEAAREGMGDPCARRDVIARAGCFLVTGAAADAERLADALDAVRLARPSASGSLSKLWELAIGHDILLAWPELSPQRRARTEARIREQVLEVLRVLDGGVAALWHKRASLAANAWLGAVVLDPRNPQDAALQARAQGHLLDNLSALGLSGAWPEGYNYWVNNRALLLALAGAAYVNGLEGARGAAQVREVLRRAGYWTLYATRPDGRVEGLADEGPRVDLKDETRRAIDVIVQVTRDPLLAGYSRYLARLRGRESYYRGYRGQFLLFNDPSVAPAGDGTLASLAPLLPGAELFGEGIFNLALLRSGWGPDDTFISFRAGHNLSHHGHYDAGHFSLFKGAPLAVNSSSYSGISTENRLYYAIRSVAKNTLLVLRPGDGVQPTHRFELAISDGGQRLTLPTGSTLDSVDSFFANLDDGMRLAGGQLIAFESTPQRTLVAADLTAAYDSVVFDTTGAGGKVGSVKRHLLYLRGEDRLLVHDDVTATDPSYVKKWLLHTAERPQAQPLRVLAGTREGGILETPSPRLEVANGPGRLVVDRLFPGDAVARLVGGPGYRSYVEIDGDETALDGRAFPDGASDRRWFERAEWRIEIQPPPRRLRDRFLVALSPSLDAFRREIPRPLASTDGRALGVAFEAVAALFIDARPRGEVVIEGGAWPVEVHLVGLPPTAPVTARIGDGLALDVDPRGHVRTIRVPPGAAPGALRVAWE